MLGAVLGLAIAVGAVSSGCAWFSTPTVDVTLAKGLKLTYRQKVGGTTVAGAPLKVDVLKVTSGAGGLDRVTIQWERKPKAEVRKAGTGERRSMFTGRRTITGVEESHVMGPRLAAQERTETPMTSFWISRAVMAELKKDGESTLTFEGQLHRIVVKQEQYNYTAVVDGRTSNLRAMWIVTRELDASKEADLIVLDDARNPLVLKFDPRPYSLSGWELADVKSPASK